jgi:hypothetical protein
MQPRVKLSTLPRRFGADAIALTAGLILIDAYQVQLEHNVKAHGEQWREEYLTRYSKRLAESYRLGITPDQARALLSQ